MKQVIFILCLILTIAIGCKKDSGKETQTIEFGEIAPQILKDGSVQLRAQASSGLSVIFESTNTSIATINGNTTVFLKSGLVNIVASQPGNEQYYEAPNIVRSLTIHDWDPNKKSQTISFELPESWTNDDPYLVLKATASSGLPVKFTSGDSKGRITENNELILYHGPYPNTYDTYINITASQEGNQEYNPADNVVRTIHALGIGTH